MRTLIALGVIYNKTRDKILVARRPSGTSHGGFWEFPGGKQLPGEKNYQTLIRELREELSLTIESAIPLITIDHDYPDSSVTLNVWKVNSWHGDVKGNEGQRIEWVTLETLGKKRFPAANRPIITSVRLPHLYLITPDLHTYNERYLKDLDIVLKSGVSLLQFRSNKSTKSHREKILIETIKTCNRYSCRVIVNDTPEAIKASGYEGVHITSRRLLELKKRPLPSQYWVAASCHNEKELDHACDIGIDFAVLAPVGITKSHPGHKPLGWMKFSQMVRRATIPVYALGGMNIEDLKIARENGGQGISLIRAIWDAQDKERIVKRILDQDGSVETGTVLI